MQTIVSRARKGQDMAELDAWDNFLRRVRHLLGFGCACDGCLMFAELIDRGLRRQGGFDLQCDYYNAHRVAIDALLDSWAALQVRHSS